jgi:membrane AbrB-like protein
MGSTALATLKTLAIAAVGGVLFKFLGTPMPWMLGSLIICMVASQFIANVHVPTVFREILQPVLGVSLGSFFTPSLFSELSRWPAVLAILAAYLVVATLFGVFYFRRVAGYDLTTAFFSAIPGGLADLTLIGASMGANIVLLGLIHSIRVLMVVVSIPFILSLFAGPIVSTGARAVVPLELSGLVILTLCGIVGYVFGRVTRMPAGGVLAPLLVSAAVHLMGITHSSPPASMINVVQVVLGAYIGARFVDLQWSHFRSALIHGLIWGTGLILLSILAAFLCSQVTDFGLAQLLLGFAPGGVAEMGLLTIALGIDVALVTTCHVARVILVYMIVPIATRGGTLKPVPVKDTGLTDD